MKTGTCETEGCSNTFEIKSQKIRRFCDDCRLERKRASDRKRVRRYRDKGRTPVKFQMEYYTLPEDPRTHCKYCGRKLSVLYNKTGECLSDCDAKKAALGKKYVPMFCSNGGSDECPVHTKMGNGGLLSDAACGTTGGVWSGA